MAVVGAILAGAAIVGTGLKVYDYIQNADQRRIQNEVMTESAAFNKDLLRRARGKFTDAELSQIQQANAPALQAVSGNVSARLGAGSPLAASLTNQAQQQTVFNAQQHATRAHSACVAAGVARCPSRTRYSARLAKSQPQ